MKTKQPFVLVPTVGDSSDDILRHFDGQGEQMRSDAASCQIQLRQGARPMLDSRSTYEPILPPERSCLALEAAAREAQRVGFSELAQVITNPDVRQRQAMVNHLASDLTPQAPGPTVAPTGPSRR